MFRVAAVSVFLVSQRKRIFLEKLEAFALLSVVNVGVNIEFEKWNFIAIDDASKTDARHEFSDGKERWKKVVVNREVLHVVHICLDWARRWEVAGLQKFH